MVRFFLASNAWSAAGWSAASRSSSWASLCSSLVSSFHSEARWISSGVCGSQYWCAPCAPLGCPCGRALPVPRARTVARAAGEGLV